MKSIIQLHYLQTVKYYSKFISNKNIGLLNYSISFSDLVQEKTGIIQNEYILFNPPIGVGSFGEVRQAVHKTTNLKRAIKIIPKDSCPLKKQKKLIKEFEILKSLVCLLKKISK